MDLNAVNIFVKVVRANGITHAARELQLPKSTVSFKLRKLEDDLGVRLLHRTTRTLALTDEGRDYFAQAARLIDELHDAGRTAADRQGSARGLIRLTAPVDYGAAYLGRFVAGFRERCPDVVFEIDLTGRAVNLIDEGFDVALRMGQLEDSALACKKIQEIGQRLVAAPGYLKAQGAPQTLGALIRHACLVHSDHLKAGGWRLKDAQGVQLHPPTRAFACNSFVLLRELALLGHGICVLPDYLCAEALRSGRLVEVLPQFSLEPVPVFVVFPSRKLLPMRVRKFLDYLEGAA